MRKTEIVGPLFLYELTVADESDNRILAHYAMTKVLNLSTVLIVLTEQCQSIFVGFSDKLFQNRSFISTELVRKHQQSNFRGLTSIKSYLERLRKSFF